jgi:hypothetical protein
MSVPFEQRYDAKKPPLPSSKRNYVLDRTNHFTDLLNAGKQEPPDLPVATIQVPQPKTHLLQDSMTAHIENSSISANASISAHSNIYQQKKFAMNRASSMHELSMIGPRLGHSASAAASLSFQPPPSPPPPLSGMIPSLSDDSLYAAQQMEYINDQNNAKSVDNGKNNSGLYGSRQPLHEHVFQSTATDVSQYPNLNVIDATQQHQHHLQAVTKIDQSMPAQQRRVRFSQSLTELNQPLYNDKPIHDTYNNILSNNFNNKGSSNHNTLHQNVFITNQYDNNANTNINTGPNELSTALSLQRSNSVSILKKAGRSSFSKSQSHSQANLSYTLGQGKSKS